MKESTLNKKYNMPLTLEIHFEELANRYETVKELHSLWILLKKRLIEELSNSRNVWPLFKW